MLTPTELRSLYDIEQRRDIEFSDSRREPQPHVVRHINLHHPQSWVLYSSLTTENADAIIEEEIAYFESIGHEFEWKLFAHDLPADLKERLVKRGFELGEPEAVMVLDLEVAPDFLLQTVTQDVRRITKPEDITEMLHVLKVVWDESMDMRLEELITTTKEFPDQLSIYAAYADGKPVSGAWVRFEPDNRWGSLWGGSTLKEYRGRGFYSALLAVRAQEAIQRGRRFLTIDASPMSQPIVEKLGFQWLTTTYECNWTRR